MVGRVGASTRHTQLSGWAGLFVLSMGLFYLPRLRETTRCAPNSRRGHSHVLSRASRCALAQRLLAILAAQMSQESLCAALGCSGLALSSVIELVDALLVVTMLVSLLAIATARRGGFLYVVPWNDALTYLTLMLMGFPMALALFDCNLPLFMRLAVPPRRERAPFFVSYVTGLLLRPVG